MADICVDAVWVLKPLMYEMPITSRSLLDMRVTGCSDTTFTLPVKYKTAAIPTMVPEIDEVGNPFSTASVDEPNDTGDHGEEHLDEDEIVDARSDDDAYILYEDVGEEAYTASEEDVNDEPMTPVDSEPDDAVDDDAAPDDVVDDTEVLESIDGGQDHSDEYGEVAHPHVPTIDQYMANSIRGEGSGNITSTLPPYDAMWRVGRWSDYPQSVEPKLRNFSMACSYHKKCSVTRKRHRVSDEVLLRWLFSGEVLPPGSNDEQKSAAQAKHQKLFKEMVP